MRGSCSTYIFSRYRSCALLQENFLGSSIPKLICRILKQLIAVVIIVVVVTDFEMTFTVYLFGIAWQNNYFVFKVTLPQIKFCYGPLNYSGERSWAILALLLDIPLGKND